MVAKIKSLVLTELKPGFFIKEKNTLLRMPDTRSCAFIWRPKGIEDLRNRMNL